MQTDNTALPTPPQRADPRRDYFPVHKALWGLRLPPSAKLVALGLLSFWGPEGIFCGQTALARKCCVGISTVRRALLQLGQHGVISRRPVWLRNRRRGADHYTLFLGGFLVGDALENERL